jgi:hypothetical protein
MAGDLSVITKIYDLIIWSIPNEFGGHLSAVAQAVPIIGTFGRMGLRGM